MDEQIFIKLIEPSQADIKYIKMLIKNWDNYYKPENYLLPNSDIINIPKFKAKDHINCVRKFKATLD